MAGHNPDFMRAQIRQQVRSITGQETHSTGVELAALIRFLANRYEALISQPWETGELSGARLGLLVRLLAEARRGETAGVSPTYLSQCMHVSKNTVSALLRGLEMQGLIERVLDPEDKRRFRIRLTPTGQALVETTTPQYITRLNAMLDIFTPDEVEQLLSLLTRLAEAMSSAADTSLTEG